MLGWGRKLKRNIPTVSFDATKLTPTVKSEIEQSIKSISNIPASHFKTIYNSAISSISQGRALDILYKDLILIDCLLPHEAESIACFINNRAASVINKEQQIKLGILQAIWRHSGSPCGNDYQDKAHRAFNGKQYPVKLGAILNGEKTWPSYNRDCKCISKSIVLGFNS